MTPEEGQFVLVLQRWVYFWRGYTHRIVRVVNGIVLLGLLQSPKHLREYASTFLLWFSRFLLRGTLLAGKICSGFRFGLGWRTGSVVCRRLAGNESVRKLSDVLEMKKSGPATYTSTSAISVNFKLRG